MGLSHKIQYGSGHPGSRVAASIETRLGALSYVRSPDSKVETFFHSRRTRGVKSRGGREKAKAAQES